MLQVQSILDLQRLAATLGYPVVTDGDLGPRTRGAWSAILAAAGQGAAAPRFTLLVRAGTKITTDYHGPGDLRPGGRHDGLDLAELQGDPCEAAEAGEVIWAGEARRADGSGDGYGLQVQLRHADGAVTRYAHLSRLDVRAGQRVSAGEVLGACGSTGKSTGPHLHFEVLLSGQAVDPWGRVRVVWAA